ncbi:MAG: PIN domain-containing protein [Alphaproteobacteria bacterium]|nr:PIN domain-containing protein [Alphaproteobacteria bacterium]
MPLVFADANVLIAAARGIGPRAQPALAVLDNPAFKFAASDFLRLEVVPKAVHHRRTDEAAFYRTFFEGVSVWAIAEPKLVRNAMEIAQRFGLAALDALHVAAAASVRADALITAERVDKPIHRVTILPIWPVDR